jgi:hypothetical protein
MLWILIYALLRIVIANYESAAFYEYISCAEVMKHTNFYNHSFTINNHSFPISTGIYSPVLKIFAG